MLYGLRIVDDCECFMTSSEWAPVAPGVKRRTCEDGEKLMVLEVDFEAGAAVPTHAHVHEQVSYVVKGRMKFTVEGKVIEVAAGESVRLPSNAPHAAQALEASRLLDIFSPPREDFRK